MRKQLLNSWAFAALLLCCQGAYADDWMGRLPDHAYVAQLSIPGTHDTATGEGFLSSSPEGDTFSKAQDLTLSEQLADGIRAFDFRPSYKDGYLNCAHGMSETNITFQKALETLRDFLQAHPTEFFILHILKVSDADTDAEAEKLLHELLASEGLKDYVVDFRRDLTVKDMRGKMLLLYRDSYATNPVGGMMANWCGYIDWNAQTNGVITGAGNGPEAQAALYMQDQAETHEEGTMDTKLNAISKMLDFSTTHIVSDSRQLVWVYNFASAYSKTLFTASTSDGYRDNATHTNAAIIDYLKDEIHVAGPTGIVLMDYAGVSTSKDYATRGDELVDLLIEQNFKYIYGPSGEQPETSVAVSFKRDNDRDYTKKMGVEGKNGIPLLADFDGNGLTDVYFGGEAYLWNPIGGADGTGEWTWGDGVHVAYNQGAGTSPAWNALSNTSVSSTDDDLPVFYGGLGSRVLDYDQDGMPDLLRTVWWT